MSNNCWYCNKELQEPIVTYRRRHIKKKLRTDITVHFACYKSLARTRKEYRVIVPGTVSN